MVGNENVVHIHCGTLFSSKEKQNHHLLGDGTELEKIILSEVTQIINQTGHVLSYRRLLASNLQM